jgi:hypothetical protein
MSLRVLQLTMLLALAGSGFTAAQDTNQAAFGHRMKSPNAAEHGKVLEKDGKVYLYGGENEAWNFDISHFLLDAGKLLNGVGREYYPALVAPEFVPADSASEWLADDARVLVAAIGGEAHAYPVALMIRHEAVNDVVGGVPVLPVYCTRARMGAVFDRRIAGRTFTFGVSGYTYADPEIRDGMEVFVLWDRDTESLWWPLAGTAVSGAMSGRPLQRVDIPHWTETTWAEAKTQYPGIMVLAPGQSQRPPENWHRLSAQEIDALEPLQP